MHPTVESTEEHATRLQIFEDYFYKRVTKAFKGKMAAAAMIVEDVEKLVVCNDYLTNILTVEVKEGIIEITKLKNGELQYL